MKQEASSAQAIAAAAHAKAIGDLQAQLLEGKEAISELRTTKSALKVACACHSYMKQEYSQGREG